MTATIRSSRGARRHRAGVRVALATCVAAIGGAAIAQEPPHSAELDAAIVRAAKRHGVPEHLVRRIVMRESRYNPRAHNRSFWGLMQISYPTARSMGFKGTPEQLLNPVTNLSYAVPYLANAFIIAGKREDAAVRLYASGYYATAKSRGVLGLLRTADSKPLNGVPDEPTETPAATAVAENEGGFWSLFGSNTPAPAQPAAAADPAAPAPQPLARQQPASQQLAYAAAPEAAASPAQAQIQAVARAAPARAGSTSVKTSDKNADAEVAMVAGRDGTMAPPKRWQHDGGTSVVGRGEQRIENVAAYRLGEAAVGARRSRKTAVFAAIDPTGAPPSTATDAQPQLGSFFATTQAPVPAAADPTQAAAAQLAASEVAAGAAPDAAAQSAAQPAAKPKHRRVRKTVEQ